MSIFLRQAAFARISRASNRELRRGRPRTKCGCEMPRKLRYPARLPVARELINFNSRSCVVQLQTRAQKDKRRTTRRTFCSRALRASAFQRQIVNRNLIGRFTVFVGESLGAAPFSFCARGAFSCARHARCLRGRAYRHPIVCQPLNTGHPRSSPIFSPIATSWPIARFS